MKTRAEAAALIKKQLNNDIGATTTISGRDKYCRHYGLQELRELMDFIYEGEPKDVSEEVTL